mmetsp:Transcript_45175/g.52907  ORF Transcript_45175/g.52907 Transcript_45175/m.52907 type:complete len:484 (+) Transcript_45175:146-1597(+)
MNRSSNENKQYRKNFSGSKYRESGHTNAEVVFNQFGNAKVVLDLHRDLNIPPTPSQETGAVIEVEASTISIDDCHIRRNLWVDPVALPMSPGVDCIGRVVKVGRMASHYNIHVGNRVASLHQFLGGNARFVTLPSSDLVHVPEELPPEYAVCLVRSYVAAYQILRRAGVPCGKKRKDKFHNSGCDKPYNEPPPLESALPPGFRILVMGGNGALGRALIEISNLYGASKIFATAHAKHRRFLESMGAIWLPTNPSVWLPMIRGTIDIVVDSICADGTYNASHCALRSKKTPGKHYIRAKPRLICVGQMAQIKCMKQGSILTGVPLSSFWVRVRSRLFLSHAHFYDLFWAKEQSFPNFQQDLITLFTLLHERNLYPQVDCIIGLPDIASSQTRLENGGLQGTIVCFPWESLEERNSQRFVQGQNEIGAAAIYNDAYSEERDESPPNTATIYTNVYSEDRDEFQYNDEIWVNNRRLKNELEVARRF